MVARAFCADYLQRRCIAEWPLLAEATTREDAPERRVSRNLFDKRIEMGKGPTAPFQSLHNGGDQGFDACPETS
jgi:hypothetical protein